MINGYSYRYKNQQEVQANSVGKVISEIFLNDDVLTIKFEDSTSIEFLDDGQNCCEHRYFSVDGDDLSEFEGAKYVEAFLNDAPGIEDSYGDVHDVCFLEIRTSRGSITVSAHNEHNGYYGGFGIIVKEGK